jgi:hypothetical protein
MTRAINAVSGWINSAATLFLIGIAISEVHAVTEFSLDAEQSLGYAQSPVCQVLLKHLRTQCKQTSCNLNLSNVNDSLSLVPWIELKNEQALTAAFGIAQPQLKVMSEVGKRVAENGIRDSILDGSLKLFHLRGATPIRRIQHEKSDAVCVDRYLVKRVFVTPGDRRIKDGLSRLDSLQRKNEAQSQTDVYSMNDALTNLNHCPLGSDASLRSMASNWQASFLWKEELFAIQSGAEPISKTERTRQPTHQTVVLEKQTVVARGTSGTECHFVRLLSKTHKGEKK